MICIEDYEYSMDLVVLGHPAQDECRMSLTSTGNP